MAAAPPPSYPPDLIEWARGRRSETLAIERQLTQIVLASRLGMRRPDAEYTLPISGDCPARQLMALVRTFGLACQEVGQFVVITVDGAAARVPAVSLSKTVSRSVATSRGAAEQEQPEPEQQEQEQRRRQQMDDEEDRLRSSKYGHSRLRVTRNNNNRAEQQEEVALDESAYVVTVGAVVETKKRTSLFSVLDDDDSSSSSSSSGEEEENEDEESGGSARGERAARSVAIPSRRSRQQALADLKAEDICCICLDTLLSVPRALAHETLSLLPCRHFLHTTCAKKTRAAPQQRSAALECPLCRRNGTAVLVPIIATRRPQQQQQQQQQQQRG